MPIGHMVLKTDMPCKHFHLPSQYLYKPCNIIQDLTLNIWCTCPSGHGSAHGSENWYALQTFSPAHPIFVQALQYYSGLDIKHLMYMPFGYALQTFSPAQPIFVQALQYYSGLDIKHLMYMPIRPMVLKTDMPYKYFHLPSQYLYKPCNIIQDLTLNI